MIYPVTSLDIKHLILRINPEENPRLVMTVAQECGSHPQTAHSDFTQETGCADTLADWERNCRQ